MSSILVTGGAGAIGSSVVRTLRDRGDRVVVLDDLSSGHRSLVPEGAELIEGSVANDADLDRAFESAPDYVIHLAALFANQNSVDHPTKDLEVNGLGTLKMLERCRSANVKKMLYASSSCVYGQKPVMDEADERYMLDTPYAITKLLGEHYCRFWADQHKLDVVMVRPFNTYGPGEFPGRYRNVIPNFFALAMRGQPLTITGTGEETRDFNFMDDLVSGILGALFASTPSASVFNLASGRDTRVIDLATMINEITGNTAGINFVPARSWDHVKTRRGNIERAQKAFGYSPRTDLRTGLQRTYEWLRANPTPA